ncbi:MAG TPA: DEAD/DEAH box helicase [Acidimicrobiales bacterium]|nr:DEAD/DEAH box helicase [Acidimicrobiales bacterium]
MTIEAPRRLTVGTATHPVLDRFHPAVRSWFTGRFPGGPTAPQLAAWPLIATGQDVLVASPTGTGKTLTGFLVAIDRALRVDGPATRGLPEVVYISPLRALAADVHENLQLPLSGIRKEAERLGLDLPELTVAVRTGDTAAAERVAMRKSPPNLLVTTPESLYLLLTAASSRSLLRNVRTVIVDEVHTLARDKRGSHLALSLERLAHLVAEDGARLQRIGLSATQRPLEVVARLLSGVAEGRALPAIVDCGHKRDLDVDIELPDAELEAVAPHGQFGEVLDRIAEHVRHHRTTLVFVNTRKLAERVAHQLAERLEQSEGPEEGLLVAAHHGSLSAERRRMVESRLRAGSLRALVATASLELGIDVGPVELVCQIGSPRSIGTFLQRVGRANHQLEGTPAGRLYPLTRDELVECTALLAAVRAGQLDLLEPPTAPLDVLAQQIVAEVAAAEEWEEDGLFDLMRQASPYAEMEREAFDSVVDLVSWGIPTGRGKRGAHLHRDGVNGRLRARRGARLVALTSGGAIPETGDYRVLLDPDGVTVGSVHEDFAVEANIGDIFLLGTHSWRVKQVEVGTVRVTDAGDTPPTIPFWIGEAPARTAELSLAVSALRAAVQVPLEARDPAAARAVVRERARVSEEVADQVVTYLAAGLAALGTLPTQEHVVIERFFDEVEGTQLIIHAPFGGRINRALGLALRKRFCVSFDFELQAAADDDTVSISLGPQHSFPLDQVPKMVTSRTATDVLIQAVLPHPMLQARWRWNLNRALVVPRSRGGQRRPIHLQRMEAGDLLAAAWPQLAACQENAAPGPIPVPDHVLVRQTVEDCLHEPLDAEGLVALLTRIESGAVKTHFVESVDPSPLAHGILTGRPYTFLDDAPLEERRSRAVPLQRGLGGGGLPVPVDELAPLDGPAVHEVLDQVVPRPGSADELHELLLSLVLARPVQAWRGLFDELVADGRAAEVSANWAATERLDWARRIVDDDEVTAECVGGHLALAGPVSAEALGADGPLGGGAPNGVPLSLGRIRSGLARLEGAGVAIHLPDGRWCARHLLVRLHAASRRRRRSSVEPASLADFVRFLTRWQHATPETRLAGRSGALAVIEQLAGLEVPAGEWESQVLPARVSGYEPRWLDELCLSGEVAWGRLTPRPERPPDEGAAAPRRGGATPSPATPLALVPRQDLGWLLAAVRQGDRGVEPDAGASADVLAILRQRGACFRAELPAATGRLPAEIDDGLWDLVARGLVTADAFSAVRSLLSAKDRWRARQRRPVVGRVGMARRRSAVGSGLGEGRWALLSDDGLTHLEASATAPVTEELAEAVAWQLLTRWGVMAWELWARESFRAPWRDVIRALRRFEARGLALGGRFVAGMSGEQYALPEAAELLGRVRRSPDTDEVAVAAADPLNLTGTVLAGPRIPAVRHRQVTYRGGLVVDAPSA